MRSTICCLAWVLLLFCGCSEKAQSKVQALRVTGGSMAPTLLGEHFAVTCADCKFPFACDAQEVPGSFEAVCPNCGYAHNSLKAPQLQPGETVKLAAEGENVPLSRWQIVMFQTDRPAQPWAVKRIAALPAETWGIRGGDIWIDGEIVSKTLEEFRAVAIPVYDDDFWPSKTTDLPARWQPRKDTTPWKLQTSDDLKVASWQARLSRHETATLDYHHWRCVSSPLSRSIAAPLLDNDSYNQKLSREQNEVPDLLLSCEAKIEEGNRLVLQLSAGRQIFYWGWKQEQKLLRVGMDQDDTPLAKGSTQLTDTPDGFHRLECALVDGKIYAAVDGFTLINEPWTNKTQLPTPLAVPRAAITARGFGVQQLIATVRHIKLSRDIYYLDPQGLDRPWTSSRPLGPDEYAVLGDNSAISVDSRQDAPQGILKTQIRGRLQPSR